MRLEGLKFQVRCEEIVSEVGIDKDFLENTSVGEVIKTKNSIGI